jgi:hypothetical protein
MTEEAHHAARKELTELVRDGRFRLTAGTVLALVPHFPFSA